MRSSSIGAAIRESDSPIEYGGDELMTKAFRFTKRCQK